VSDGSLILMPVGEVDAGQVHSGPHHSPEDIGLGRGGPEGADYLRAGHEVVVGRGESMVEWMAWPGHPLKVVSEEYAHVPLGFRGVLPEEPRAQGGPNNPLKSTPEP
jgi:hypothetical protein